MRGIEREGEDAAAILRGTEQCQARHLGEARGGVVDQGAFMRLDRRHADGGDVVDRRMQADRFDDGGRAGLELRGHRRPFGFLEGDVADHVAATEHRRHAVKQFKPRPQHADAGRAVQLVAGEAVEVATDRLHIDAPVHRGLRAVEQHLRTMRVGERDDAFDRRNGAEHVRHMRDGDEADLAIGKLGLKVVHVEFAAVGDAADAKFVALVVAQHLPRDDVGVVFKFADQHRLAGLHHAAAPAMGDEVHRLGAVAGEDDLARVGGVEEAGRGGARFLIGIGGEFREPVSAAMDIGVGRFHAADHGVDHGARLLGRGAGIEEDQRAPPRLRLRQDREILPDARDVEGGGRQRVHHAAAAWRDHQASSARVNAPRRVSSVTVSTASCRKASTSMALAWDSGMPRARR